jgi:hypothetical protein
MVRNVAGALMRALVSIFTLISLILLAAQNPARSQQIDTSQSDRQIIADILKECRELYMKSVGACACADDRNKEGTRCNKAIKELPASFKPFCTRKDVTLREVSLYRMQNQGFIDQRCSK